MTNLDPAEREVLAEIEDRVGKGVPAAGDASFLLAWVKVLLSERPVHAKHEWPTVPKEGE